MLDSSFFAGFNWLLGGQVWEDPESWLVVRLNLNRWGGSVGLRCCSSDSSQWVWLILGTFGTAFRHTLWYQRMQFLNIL